jgi:hypothetical protein
MLLDSNIRAQALLGIQNKMHGPTIKALEDHKLSVIPADS